MRRVGIISVAQRVVPRSDLSPPELVYPVVKEAVAASGLARSDIGFTAAGSSDFLEGRPFSFGFALDLAGAVPPIEESHVEGDGAWAAYEAWVRIQAGEADSALVVAWGKTSEGDLARILNATLDPFWEAPLGADHLVLEALQARAWMLRTGATEQDLAEIAGDGSSPFVVEPLRRSMIAEPADGACALVMIAADTTGGQRRAAWIAGVAHATDGGSPGARRLDEVPSARAAFERAASMAGWREAKSVALHASFAHHVPMLREAFGTREGRMLAADPMMATGLMRLGAAARTIASGGARRALAHATAGHCLQANMAWLLES